jgi:hypothetical protein
MGAGGSRGPSGCHRENGSSGPECRWQRTPRGCDFGRSSLGVSLFFSLSFAGDVSAPAAGPGRARKQTSRSRKAGSASGSPPRPTGYIARCAEGFASRRPQRKSPAREGTGRGVVGTARRRPPVASDTRPQGGDGRGPSGRRASEGATSEAGNGIRDSSPETGTDGMAFGPDRDCRPSEPSGFAVGDAKAPRGWRFVEAPSGLLASRSAGGPEWPEGGRPPDAPLSPPPRRRGER